MSDGLEERVRRLEDERDIVRTLYRYAEGLDYGPVETFVDVFTEDGRWTRAPGRFGDRRFEGRTALREMWRDHTHAPEVFHKHAIVDAQVDVRGDTATAMSYLLFVCDHPDGPYIRAFSRCRDRFVRCPDGRWRILERVAELESRSERAYPPAPWQGLPPIVR